jgi:hypothetical protein
MAMLGGSKNLVSSEAPEKLKGLKFGKIREGFQQGWVLPGPQRGSKTKMRVTEGGCFH